MVSPRTTTPTKRVTKLRHMKHIKAYDYNSILLARAVPLGTTVKTVYCTNFLELPFQPHCTLIYCISWGQDAVCYMTMLNVTVPTQWFVPKMELGSSGTSTILIGYKPIWQLLSESERPIAWHPLQDQKRYHESRRASDNSYINKKRCRWCQTSSTSVTGHYT